MPRKPRNPQNSNFLTTSNPHLLRTQKQKKSHIFSATKQRKYLKIPEGKKPAEKVESKRKKGKKKRKKKDKLGKWEEAKRKERAIPFRGIEAPAEK